MYLVKNGGFRYNEMDWHREAFPSGEAVYGCFERKGTMLRKEKQKMAAYQLRAILIEVLAAVMIFLCGCSAGQRGQLISLKEEEEPGDILAEESSLESSTIESTASKEAEEEDFIWVFVCGAVESPQVVKLPVGSRAMVAVKMAGGMTGDADESFVNLAAILEDGEKLYIPTKEEAVSLSIQEEKESLVNINTAGTKELCTLLGIGESRAEDIIAYRETHGPFAAIEDIMKVPGIKENAFAKIKDAITVK